MQTENSDDVQGKFIVSTTLPRLLGVGGNELSKRFH